MSAEIDMSNGRANIAYIGQRPWHGLGADMPDGADLDQWRIAAGLNWEVEEKPVLFKDGEGDDEKMIIVPDKKVLVRSDTKFALSVVGEGYNVVQPADVIDFYKTLVEDQGMVMETAGSLMNGKRIWALARTGDEDRIKGSDLLRRYILLATGFDGKMATSAADTSVRVVCWNTFRFAIGENGQGADIRVPHKATFNASKVKAEMGLEKNSWSEYIEEANALADRKVDNKEALEYFFNLFYGNKDVEITDKHVERKLNQMLNVYGNGVGQDTASANGTAWGLHNAVTRFVDHERNSRDDGSRLNSAWFGDGNRIKARSFTNALKLVA